MPDAMPKEQLIQNLAAAFERFLATATEVARNGSATWPTGWGPREVVAHLAGWEVMASVRIPKIVAGLPPPEFADAAQNAVMNDAINATIVAMIGGQSLETVCGLLRQAYGRDIALLRQLDNAQFQPGAYVYERTRSVIEHCAEHAAKLLGEPA